MRKRIALVTAVAAVAALGLVPVSTAGGGNSSNAIEGARCVQAGVAFLVQNDLLRAAALRQIDYSDLDTDAEPAPGNDDTYSTSDRLAPFGRSVLTGPLVLYVSSFPGAGSASVSRSL